ncbi:hypothetical protein GCK72_012986 [Caenorhabditis remanei]|uniref:Uncharacterized protein n=1 Tax=Caenorhabditis remanei TaxID=31234 RepID=A0A6A5GPM3_CAERE|nr:hypothetical protein GCK72_012986 [Caenorhabditis remanei]KAF1756533.1 hypothetical protein GCK72_012986 [Caenorhabditis remanei]
MNYECLYQINVPLGLSAYIELKFMPITNTAAKKSVVQVIDFNQRVENIYHTDLDKFYFIAPGGRFKISTKDTSAQFQFSVQWFSEINSDYYEYENATQLDTQPYITENMFRGIQVTAETTVSIITIPPSKSKNLECYLKGLRSVLIFDGPDANSTCLGTALQLFNNNRQYVTSGRVVTVIPLQPISYWSDSQLMFQDFVHTKAITEYRGVSCQGYCDPMVMDGSKSPSAFSTFSSYGSAKVCLMSVSGTDVDLSQSNSLQLSVIKNNSIVYNIVYNATNLPSLNQPMSAVGDQLFIEFLAGGDIKKGDYYINYDVVKVNSAPSYLSNFVAAVVSVWMLLAVIF